MLEYGIENTWEPEILTTEEILDCTNACLDMNLSASQGYQDYLIITQVEPYIDSVYMHFPDFSYEPDLAVRFPIHEGYMWPIKDRLLFDEKCLNNAKLAYSHDLIQEIYDKYKSLNPEWHLSRYYTKNIRLLDHIYNCLQTNTAKEMLYKAGLDDLAAYSCYMDEINLLSTSPSDLYDGISMRSLRALNCREGALLLSTAEYRECIKYLQKHFPDIFIEKMNDAQCHYIRDLIEHRLTSNEIGRLYRAAKLRLMMIWNKSQYEMFMHLEKLREKALENIRRINSIDPLYMKYLPQKPEELSTDLYNYESLAKYLLHDREEYYRKVRVSNRRRDPEWQERNHGYVVRYPQTINDFCREAVYMHNCLSGYADAIVNNETTLLFMREADEVNQPFITIEIYNNKLVEAYHRFNWDCTPDEAAWIREYCKRHKIDVSDYHFNRDLDIDFGVEEEEELEYIGEDGFEDYFGQYW